MIYSRERICSALQNSDFESDHDLFRQSFKSLRGRLGGAYGRYFYRFTEGVRVYCRSLRSRENHAS